MSKVKQNELIGKRVPIEVGFWVDCKVVGRGKVTAYLHSESSKFDLRIIKSAKSSKTSIGYRLLLTMVLVSIIPADSFSGLMVYEKKVVETINLHFGLDLRRVKTVFFIFGELVNGPTNQVLPNRVSLVNGIELQPIVFREKPDSFESGEHLVDIPEQHEMAFQGSRVDFNRWGLGRDEQNWDIIIHNFNKFVIFSRTCFP